jgi:hypothetical protein
VCGAWRAATYLTSNGSSEYRQHLVTFNMAAGGRNMQRGYRDAWSEGFSVVLVLHIFSCEAFRLCFQLLIEMYTIVQSNRAFII